MNTATSLERLAYLLEIIPPLLLKTDEKDFQKKPAPNKWSKKEILGHLVDSAANNHQRFIRIQYENEPVIFYDQDKWNLLNHHQDLEKKQLVEFWRIYNTHLMHVASRITDENLERKGIGNDGSPKTLAYYIEDYIVHLEHHLRQIISY